MRCQNCSRDNPAEARFCAGCGVALTTTIEEAAARKEYLPTRKTIICKKCGQTNMVWSDSHTRFCIGCGSALVLRGLLAGEYAGFWMRLGAAVVDLFVSAPICFILLAILASISPPRSAVPALSLLVLPLYHWLFTAFLGRTLGKMLLHIKVVNASGDRPSLLQAALREIVGKPISTATLFMGFLWVAADLQKQGLHDKIAGTYVIRTARVQ